MAEQRYAQVHRKTSETDISLTLTLDGNGKQDIATGIGFFDHMLSGFTRHGFFDLDLKVAGDLEVDCHHTIEDTGIVLGNAIREALGDKKGIKRFGSMILPMDETLVLCAIDCPAGHILLLMQNSPQIVSATWILRWYGNFSMLFPTPAGMNLHMKVLSGTNNHHIIEALFKAFGKALDDASSYDPRITDILSTKGSL